MIELTLPAGSLQAALHAFAGGADAVYLGLRQFSARKHATNFTFDELARLKQEAVRQDKRIYVTLNTLVDDRELDGTIAILRRLELLQVDGVIVQDLGLASLIHADFPSLPLHCSTQLAVHTIEGVRELQRMGFSRIVLSRELTLKELTTIRQACPDVSLKVFIHGAMCYGFSGLCMASHTITGRSANRGECAQICRTWFSQTESDSTERHGFFFSMSDLAMGSDILRLRDIGMDSLKVEGRMKSPAYVRFAARYYRMILDGETDERALSIAKDELDSQFARDAGGGWTFSYGKEHPQENRHTPPLTTVQYPGHKGTAVGNIRHLGVGPVQSVIVVTLVQDIAVRDGLMVLEDEASGMQNPVRFGLSKIIQKDGRETFVGKSGTDVEIPIPPGVEPTIGSSLYRVSRHDLHVPEINESSLQPFRYVYVLEITIGTDTLRVQARGLPAWIPTGIGQSYALDIQQAKSPQQPQQNLEKVFSTPGEGLVTTASVEIINESGLVDTQVFMPLSQLKEIRRNWYDYLNTEINRYIDARVPMEISTPISLPVLPARKRISPLSDSPIPWADPEKILRQLRSGMQVETLLATIGGQIYLPLPPVMFGEQTLFDALDALIEHVGQSIVVGLNNIGQLSWARRHPEIPCFADIYLYMTNRRAAQMLVDSIPNIGGMYGWIEREYLDASGWPCDPSQVGKDFSIPLFISRNCYRYDTLKLPCEGCPRNGSWKIEQNGRPYRVDVRNCVTIVSEQPEEQ